jgi:hypothetical protein
VVTLSATNHTGGVQQTLTVTVDQAPRITSPNTVNSAVGKAFSFTVTATGNPVPTLSETGGLPSGVVFTANSDGTATISGTPATAGTYPLTITATSSAGTATQSLSLVVTAAPTITSANKVTFTTGTAGSFTETTTGTPAPAIAVSGALPPGLSFTDNKDGTATLAGTPAATAGGNYTVTVTATNSVGSTKQALTVTVHQPPQITSASTLTVAVRRSFTFRITTTGYPVPTVSKTGTLPPGVQFTARNNGTATISGTPWARGTYPLTITATGAGTATQSFTLTVR